jgi:hypothetical protein
MSAALTKPKISRDGGGSKAAPVPGIIPGTKNEVVRTLRFRGTSGGIGLKGGSWWVSGARICAAAVCMILGRSWSARETCDGLRPSTVEYGRPEEASSASLPEGVEGAGWRGATDPLLRQREQMTTNVSRPTSRNMVGR